MQSLFFLKSGKRFKRSIAHNNLKLTCNIYHIQVFKLRPFLQIGLRWRHLDIRRWGGWVGGRVFERVGGAEFGKLWAGSGNFWVAGRVLTSFFVVVLSRGWRRRLSLPDCVLTLKFCRSERLLQSSVNIAWGWEGSTRVRRRWGGIDGGRSRGEVRVGVSLTT